MRRVRKIQRIALTNWIRSSYYFPMYVGVSIKSTLVDINRCKIIEKGCSGCDYPYRSCLCTYWYCIPTSSFNFIQLLFYTWNNYSSQVFALFYFVGYVLDCIPSASETWKSYSDQLHFLWDLEMKPDYIINLKVC